MSNMTIARLSDSEVQDIAVTVTAFAAGRMDGAQTVASIVAQVDRMIAVREVSA